MEFNLRKERPFVPGNYKHIRWMAYWRNGMWVVVRQVNINYTANNIFILHGCLSVLKHLRKMFLFIYIFFFILLYCRDRKTHISTIQQSLKQFHNMNVNVAKPIRLP